VGTNQLHPSLRTNPLVELHEQTDIRAFDTEDIDIVVIDVSFIGLREILPSVVRIADRNTQIVAMVKPQFEAGSEAKHKGVIKNDRMRRDILASFEQWALKTFIILDKADSEVAGTKGNRERFYLLACLPPQPAKQQSRLRR
jgi:23S rRNA (cytidine1920-2'-O)/16S rRNA (cytidine1409-2'-O)-methyltransferase